MGYNGSENFAKGKRFGFFPAFSLGWRLTQEDFMKGIEWLNNLKIRASYGQVGNDIYSVNGVIQRFLYEEKWSQIVNDYYFGTTGRTGIFESQYPNYNVTWEKAHKYDVGLDFSIFNGLLYGNIDYFYENRNNILTQYLSRPQWVGVVMAAGNLGETKNQGFEVELHHSNTIGKEFRYNVGFSFSHAKNEILNMDEPDLKTAYRRQEGNPINQFYGLICDGFVTSADLANPDFPVSTYGDVKVGDLKYRDMNGDGQITEDDRTIIGDTNPDFTYGITNNLSWKNFSMSFMLQGSQGNDIFNYNLTDITMSNIGNVTVDAYNGRWTEATAKTARWPKATSGYTRSWLISNRYVENGSYLKMKYLTIGYDWKRPLRWIESMRITLTANNLFTITKYSWFDPDVNAGGANAACPGVDSYSYPSARSYALGVKFEF
jgi:TonB-linked SusC/RagA family outer membrane protein